jgi:uncharacterized RDD family membrane protein YckC
MPLKKYPSFWSRVLAYVLDNVLVNIVARIVLSFFTVADLHYAIALMFSFDVFWAFYSFVFHTSGGQTPGKMICRIRLADAESLQTPPFIACMKREIPWLCISALLLLIFILQDDTKLFLWKGSLWTTYLKVRMGIYLSWCVMQILKMRYNAQQQTHPDLFARTVVIRKNYKPAQAFEFEEQPEITEPVYHEKIS